MPSFLTNSSEFGCRRDHEPHSPCVRRGMSRSRLLVRSLAQSRKVDRKPWGTAATFIRRTTAESVISDSAPPRGAGNRRSVPVMRESSFKRATTGIDNGTLCSRPIFIRFPGTAQTAAFRGGGVTFGSLFTPYNQFAWWNKYQINPIWIYFGDSFSSSDDTVRLPGFGRTNIWSGDLNMPWDWRARRRSR